MGGYGLFFLVTGLRANISEIIEAKMLSACYIESYLGTYIMPLGPQASKFFGLDDKDSLSNFRRTNRNGGITISPVVDIQTLEDARICKAKCRMLHRRICEGKRKCTELSERSIDLRLDTPLTAMFLLNDVDRQK
jgi:hypothetical protein